MSRVKAEPISNGILWISEELRTADGFHVGCGTRQGSEKESKKDTETTHLNEHMLFLSSTTAKTLEFIDHMDAKGISSDGETTRHYCFGYFFGPTMQRAEIMRIGHEALVREDFDKDTFEREKRVIYDELKLHQSDETWKLMYNDMEALMYGGTRYGITFEESAQSVLRISLPQFLRFRQRLFRPGNLTLVTVGKLKRRELESIVEHSFGTIPPATKDLQPYVTDVPMREGFIVREEKDVKNAMMLQTLNAGPPTEKLLPAFHVLSDIIGQQYSGRLFKEFRIKRGWGYYHACLPEVARPNMLLHLTYSSNPFVLDKSVRLLDEIIDNLATTDIPKGRLAVHRKKTIMDQRREFNDEEHRIGWYLKNSTLGWMIKPDEFIARIKKVTPRQVRHLAERLREHRSTLIYEPRDPSQYDNPSQLSLKFR